MKEQPPGDRVPVEIECTEEEYRAWEEMARETGRSIGEIIVSEHREAQTLRHENAKVRRQFAKLPRWNIWGF